MVPVRDQPARRLQRTLIPADSPHTGRNEACMSDAIMVGQVAIRFLLEGKASGGSVAVFEFDVPAGARVPIAHSHDAYEETIYGIDGVLTFTLEERTIEVGPGDALCIPRGAVHRFDNLHA